MAHELPEHWSISHEVNGNVARRLVTPSSEFNLSTSEEKFWAETSDSRWRVLHPGEQRHEEGIALQARSPIRAGKSIKAKDLTWLGTPSLISSRDVLRSYQGAFSFRIEDPDAGRTGLRQPQVGAVYALLGYWTTRRFEPATVVMPTGTGKTETMLALLVAAQIERLLVVVPSDALREQLASKFETLGKLREFEIVKNSALCPIVCKLRHSIQDAEDAKRLASVSNVIITTPAVLTYFSEAARSALLETCTHLFVDEAHHVAAATWRQIRNSFAGKHVVQFTATPFRTDGADLGGRFIYNFSLKEARRQKYFSKIKYVPVMDLGDPDRAVAQEAVTRLRQDLEAGLEHILMARVQRIGRARDEILPIYEELASDLNPVVVDSRSSLKARTEALRKLRDGTSRIVVCVDMLGEGYDLPSLKVAAIHDPHKSLGITLQFVGRFARVGDLTIGDASVVVSRTDPHFDENLKRLYAEDADWNDLIEVLSASAVDEQEEVSEFELAFASLPEDVSLRNIAPRMSTVVYRTQTSRWHPDELSGYFGDRLLTVPIAVNERDKVAWLVTREQSPVRWGNIKTIENTTYELYVIYWDTRNGLLYINSSNNESVHQELADAVCDQEAKLLKGAIVYRTMAKIKRRVPTNVGMLDVRNRNRRFTLSVGTDVTLDFPEAEKRNKSQTNIFASGFENGNRVNAGASLKGRVWNYKAAFTLKHWMEWCKEVGAKLTDETIDPEEVLKGFIIPEDVTERPNLIPLGLEWPLEFYFATSEGVEVELNGSKWPIIDVEFEITEFKREGPIPFNVAAPGGKAAYELSIADGHMKFSAVDIDPQVATSRTSVALSEYLQAHGLRILFEKEAVVEPALLLVQPKEGVDPYSRDRLEVIDWTGINIRKESQGKTRDADSVQARAIRHILTTANWDLVMDDDGTGEIADVVAVRIDGTKLIVNLVHCKYSHGDLPGHRVEDLYEVCGQVHKSTKWRSHPEQMFRKLIQRERTRRKSGHNGFEKGTDAVIFDLLQRAPTLDPAFTMTIVQPGVSKAAASHDQLHLLACAEVYAMDTANSRLDVIVSS